ncbi:MAG: hypothetical protein V1808_03805 [Candidatus Daviesbacteria bacterium]
MIVAAVLIIIVCGLIEFWLFKQRTKNKIQNTKIQVFNTRLEAIKALSYLPSSKRTFFREDLNEAVNSFFIQKKYTALTLIKILPNSTSSYLVLRYSLDQMAGVEDSLPNSLENGLISRIKTQQQEQKNLATNLTLTGESKWQVGVITPLFYQKSILGYLIFLSEEKSFPQEEEINFLSTVARIFILVLEKFYLNKVLTPDEQIKAGNVIW